MKQHDLDADRPHRRLANGRGSIRRRWASARSTPRRRSCKRHGLGLNDLDAWEINEAFAAQVLGCLRRVAGRRVLPRASSACRARWARSTRTKLNVDGGAIALGHPVGASGARIVLHLLERAEAHRRQARHRVRSASAAAWAARCWWKRCRARRLEPTEGPSTATALAHLQALALGDRPRRARLAHLRQGRASRRTRSRARRWTSCGRALDAIARASAAKGSSIRSGKARLHRRRRRRGVHADSSRRRTRSRSCSAAGTRSTSSPRCPSRRSR